MVRDNCLLPTKDASELGYVRESTDKQYVPDVFYKVSQKSFEISFRFFPLFSSKFLIQLHLTSEDFVSLKRSF